MNFSIENNCDNDCILMAGATLAAGLLTIGSAIYLSGHYYHNNMLQLQICKWGIISSVVLTSLAIEKSLDCFNNCIGLDSALDQ